MSSSNIMAFNFVTNSAEGLIMDLEKRVLAAVASDPLRELAQELYDEGMDEAELITKLKAMPAVSYPSRIALQNKLRDVVFSHRNKKGR